MKRILLAALLAAVPAVAQVPAPPVRVLPAEPIKPAETAAPTFRAKQVLGTKVNLAGDVNIGVVEDLVFDDAGNLEYMIVANDGKLVTVPWEAAKFNFEKQIATLSITQEQYKVIPTYTVKTYPSFYTPTYRTETYKYYELKPRDLRRLGR